MILRVTPAAALALAAALCACSTTHSSTAGRQAAAAQGTSSQAAAPQSGEGALPVYPGAVKASTQMQRPMKLCGSTVTATVYHVAGANADTVSKWYGDRMVGGVHMSFHADTGTTAATSQDEAIFAPSGASSVMVLQMHLTSPKLAAAAKTIGADQTTIGLNTYDPPFSPDVVHAMLAASQGDAAAKAAARAAIKAKCGSDVVNVGG